VSVLARIAPGLFDPFATVTRAGGVRTTAGLGAFLSEDWDPEVAIALDVCMGIAGSPWGPVTVPPSRLVVPAPGGPAIPWGLELPDPRLNELTRTGAMDVRAFA